MRDTPLQAKLFSLLIELLLLSGFRLRHWEVGIELVRLEVILVLLRDGVVILLAQLVQL